MSGVSKYKAGMKFSFITILEDTKQRKKNGSVVWKCQCDCGNIIYRSTESIIQSMRLNCVISCGCKKKRDIGQRELNNPIRKEKALQGIYPYKGTTLQGVSEQKIQKNNTSGVRGVAWDKRSNRWRARIMFRRKEYCKYFDTKEEAIAYRQYLESIYYEPIIEEIKKQKEKEENGKQEK